MHRLCARAPPNRVRDDPTSDPTVETLRLEPGTQNSVLSTLVSGVKWNVKASMVLTGQVQWRVGNAGLTAARFATEGKGEAQPIAPNDTAANKQRNRRVDVVIRKK